MSPITAVFFDLGKVILDFDHHAICRRLAPYGGLRPAQVYENIFLSGLEARFDRGELSPEAFFKEAVSSAGLDIGLDQFRTIWTNIFALQDGIDRLIQRLAGRYELLCISNTNVWQFEFCRRNFPVLSYFKKFILSYEVGQRKPHPDIYKAALDSIQAPPQQCVYIDDIAEFAEAARQLGMHAIQFISVESTLQQLRRAGIDVDFR